MSKHTIQSSDKSVPNFSTTIELDGEKKEIQCVNGKIETDDDVLAEYLESANPFVDYTNVAPTTKGEKALVAENKKLNNENAKLAAENLALMKKIDGDGADEEPVRAKEETAKEKKEREKAEAKARKAAGKK